MKCSSWEVTSSIRRHKIIRSLSFFPWCAKSNATMRFAWWWRFLLQCCNESTPSVPAPRKQLSWSLGANVPLENAGRRWICLCLYVAFKTALCNLTHVCVCTDVQSEVICFIRDPYFGLACFRIFDFVNYNQWSSMFQRLWHGNSLVSWSVR